MEGTETDNVTTQDKECGSSVAENATANEELCNESLLSDRSVDSASSFGAEDGSCLPPLQLDDLPEAVILNNVLGRLTIRSILRLGCTSRRWKSIVEMLEIPTLAPWCIVTPIATCDEDLDPSPGFPLVYDINEKAWFEWALTSTFVSSSNGYVLLEEDKEFVMKNPFKNSYVRRVPKANASPDEYDRCGTLSTLLVEKDDAIHAPKFKIIEQRKAWVNNWCVMEISEASQFSVYDSATDVWDTEREFKPRLCLRAGRPVKLKGSLYYLTKVRASNLAELQKDEFLYRLVACSLRSARNHNILSRFPGRFQFVFLFEYQSRWMLFGAIWNSQSKDGERSLRTCVWQLEEKNMAWVEVQKLPRKVFLEFCKKTDPWEHATDNDRFSDNTRCATSGDYLCVFDNSTTSRMLICNLKRKSWSVVQMHEAILNRYGGLELHMFDPWLHVPLNDIICHRKNPSVVFPFLSPGDPGRDACIRRPVGEDWLILF